MLRGANNLPLRETWLRRHTMKPAESADQRRVQTYGLSPRGGVSSHPVEVFNPRKLEELLRRTPELDAAKPRPTGPSSPRVRFTVNPGQHAPAAAHTSAVAVQAAQQPALSKKEWRRQMLQEKHDRNMARTREQVHRSVEVAGHRRELRFQKNLKELRDDDEFVRALYDDIDHHDASQRMKQKKLFQEWEREVFNKIQTQVVRKVDSLDIFELERRKMQLFNSYMSAENRMVRVRIMYGSLPLTFSAVQQEGIKRDEVSTGDYDPYAWQQHAVKYSSRKLKDPIKRDLGELAINFSIDDTHVYLKDTVRVEKMFEDRLGPQSDRGVVPRSRTKVMLNPSQFTKEKLVTLNIRRINPVACKFLGRAGRNTLRQACAGAAANSVTLYHNECVHVWQLESRAGKDDAQLAMRDKMYKDSVVECLNDFQ